MKKILIILFTLALCASAFAAAETAGEPDIVGNIEDGSYTLLVHTKPGDDGWCVDGTEELEAMLSIAEAMYTDEGFFVRLAPVSDGTATVRLVHQDEDFVCDRVYTFDLLIKDGAVRESIGGSYTASPAEEEQDPCLSGEWAEKDSQITRMTVAQNADKGWNVEIVSPVTHEAYIFKADIRYDCGRDAFVYSDGEQFNAPVETDALGDPVYGGERGLFRFVQGEDGALSLVWINEFFVERTVTFVREEAGN